MILKQYLPFRFSREGWIPHRLQIHFTDKTAKETEEELTAQKKTAHYHLAKDGTVTALTPLSSAATYFSRIDKDDPDLGKRGILILMEGAECSEEQYQPLIRLFKGIQQEILRIYGQPFPFSRNQVTSDGPLPLEELLELGYVNPNQQTLYRVQTGNYRTRADAEDRIECLQKAGIAAYITEVKYPEYKR